VLILSSFNLFFKKRLTSIHSCYGDHTVGNLALPRLQALRHRRRPQPAILPQPSFLRTADTHWSAYVDIPSVHATVTDSVPQQLSSTTRRELGGGVAAGHHRPSDHLPQRSPASATPKATSFHLIGKLARGGGCTDGRRRHPRLHVFTAQHGPGAHAQL
jgi:hypothetical protein